MNIGLVIFDCDGVLIDSEPIANRVFAEQLASVGLSMTHEEVMQRFMGHTREGCLTLAAELLGRALPDNFAADWDASLFNALRQEVRAIDGVTDVLQQLDAPFCVASNSTPERVRISLGACGLLPLFEGRLFSAVQVSKPKPAPDLFLYAATSLGVAPSRCVVIEDTVTGVRAAIAAGMRVFAYAGARSDTALLQAAGASVFNNMRMLPGLLRKL